MRALFLIPVFYILSLHLQAQLIERYTYHDDEKQHLKEIFHVQDTFNNVLEGPYMSYYLNGNIESKGQFSNNETVGVWEFYYETGKLKMRGALKDNSNFGNWEYFYENGNKQMEGLIINRKREGPWRMFYESGELKSEGSFENNKRSGLWTVYFEDGKRKGQIEYNADKGNYLEYYHTGEKKAEGPKSGTDKYGKWKYYFKDGNVQAEGEFVGNKRAGNWIFYHTDGKASSKGEYNEGKPVNEWTYYYESGEVSSKGFFDEGGSKAGTWNAYYPDGGLKSTTVYQDDEGLFQEYYADGTLKASGKLIDGVKHGVWKYFYHDGKLEGEVEFDLGKGEYKGFYPDGTLQAKGMIENDQRIGTWELYDRSGELKGYYNIFYENDSIDFTEIKVSTAQDEKPKIKYGVADYGYKKSKFRYFRSKVNEFEGLIISTNPFTTFIGWLPIGVEFYLQDRLGHELIFEGLRDPFFTANDKVNINDVYTRGYRISLRQKFYNPDSRFGLWYFGHSIDYSNYNHFVNTAEMSPDEITTATASEFKIIWSLMLGYRLMGNTHSKGFTADGYISLGTGYRNFQIDDHTSEEFDSLPRNEIPLDFNFGITFGYIYPVKRR